MSASPLLDSFGLPLRSRARNTVGFWLVSGIALMIASILVSGTVAIWERQRVASSYTELRDRLRPAQTAAAELARAYIDQETGQRGFLLTGRPEFLQPYLRGETSAQRLQGDLRRLFAADPQSLRDLDAVEAAGSAWQRQAARPEIAARQQGSIEDQKLQALTLKGKELFDTLRSRLDHLTGRVNELVQEQLAVMSTAQQRANLVTALAAALGIVVAVATVLLLHHIITRPANRLLAELSAVSSDSPDGQITVDGPEEIRIIARAAEQMRQRLVESSAALVEAEHRLSIRQERERMAKDLRDNTIQRLFALGLSLTSVATSRPDIAHRLTPLVDETDRIIRELRLVLFPSGGRPGAAQDATNTSPADGAVGAASNDAGTTGGDQEPARQGPLRTGLARLLPHR